MKISESDVAQSCPTLCNPTGCSLPHSAVHGIFPGKSTRVGCQFLLQRIFPIQGSNAGFLHCRQMLYCLSHQGQTQIMRRRYKDRDMEEEDGQVIMEAETRDLQWGNTKDTDCTRSSERGRKSYFLSLLFFRRNWYLNLWILASGAVRQCISVVLFYHYVILLWKQANECEGAKSLQLYPTLCDPIDCSPLGFFVHGILQARIPQWVAMPSSREQTNRASKNRTSKYM